MLLQFCAIGVTMSWDEGFLGARASRPHQAWHRPGHLPHLDQPGIAPWLSFGLADAVPARSVAACSIALKLSGGQRDKYAGGTPALPGDKGQDAGGTPALPGDAVPAVRWGVSGGRLLRKPTCALWETPVCPREILGATAGDDTLRLVSAYSPRAGKITRQVSSRLDH